MPRFFACWLILCTSGVLGQWKQAPPVEALKLSAYSSAASLKDRSVFLHQRDVICRESDGTVTVITECLPAAFDQHFGLAVAPNGQEMALVGGLKPVHWRLRFGPTKKGDAPSVQVLVLPSPSHAGAVGAVACFRDNDLYYSPGGNGRQFQRFRDGNWDSLPETSLVNAIGKWSAGLFSIPAGIVAFGDHHVGGFDVQSDTWPAAQKVIGLWPIRPALGYGGAVAQSHKTKDLYATLGRGSNSVALMQVNIETPTPVSYFLQPRLPIRIKNPSTTLWVSRLDESLNYLDPTSGVIYSIACSALQRIGCGTQQADRGSPWVVWNATNFGAIGDLVRVGDSDSSICFQRGRIHHLRKNLLRRFELQNLFHSPPMAGHHYGGKFAKPGLALVGDGAGKLWLCTGHSRRFYEVDTLTVAPLVPLTSYKVKTRARLPEKLSGNTSLLHWGNDSILGVFNTSSRMVWKLDLSTNKWSPFKQLPEGLPYSADLGMDLLKLKGDLVVLSGDQVTSLNQSMDWSEVHALPGKITANGGASAVDVRSGKIWSVLGNGSRTLMMWDSATQTGKSWTDALPDATSVHGRRIFFAQAAGQRWLFLMRGHDSSEIWASPVSKLPK